MTVRFLRAALRDLAAIDQYIRQDNPDAANRVIAHIEAHIGQLLLFPYSGRPARPTGTRELVLPRLPYIVTYRITDDQIDILRIWHMAQRRI
jgi:addiction module RelE/StbE family toxin